MDSNMWLLALSLSAALTIATHKHRRTPPAPLSFLLPLALSASPHLACSTVKPWPRITLIKVYLWDYTK